MLCYASFKGDVNPKYGSFRWHKLEDALKETGIIIAGDSHDALVDAKSTRDLLQWIADQQTTWEVALQMAVDIISLDGPIPDELFESLSKITYRKKGE
jgi:inhibitor of KinA sporulation pathway (predicted exonuclease)